MLVSNFRSSKQKTQFTHAKLSVTKCVEKKKQQNEKETATVEYTSRLSAWKLYSTIVLFLFTYTFWFSPRTHLFALAFVSSPLKAKRKRGLRLVVFKESSNTLLFFPDFFSLHLLDPFFFPLFGFLSFLFSKPSHASSAFALDCERFLLKYSQQTNFTSSYEST